MSYRRMIAAAALVGLLGLAGCTVHVKGVVLDEMHRPITDAVVMVGYPAGVGTFERHAVDPAGKFDFWIPATDENHLYVWDGKGDPLIAARKIDRGEISDRMTILTRRGSSEY